MTLGSPLHHDHVFDAWGVLQGAIGVSLQRHEASPTVPPVCRDQHRGLGVVDATGQRVGAEATEDDGVGCTDACTGQHRESSLGDHGQVDRDPVALLHAQVREGLCEGRDGPMQLPIRENADVAGLSLPNERGLVPSRSIQVPVDAVVTHVQLPTHEPTSVRGSPIEHGVPVFEPIQLTRPPGPESFGVLRCPPVDFRIGQHRCLTEGWRRGEPPILREERFESGWDSAHGQRLQFRVRRGPPSSRRPRGRPE